MTKGNPNIAIIGAGIIGLSCAWELAKRGAQVTVFEKQWPPIGASWAAAGMLAPAFEAAAEDGAHPQLFDLSLESARVWRKFAAELETASGMDVGYCEGPTLAVALDAAEADRLLRLRDILMAGNVPVERLFRAGLAIRERGVAPDMEEALLLPSDGHVDSRMALLALRRAVEALGGQFRIGDYVEDAGQLPEGADACLVATGSAARGFVRPVKGVMLAFRRADLPLDHVVRCGMEYAVPRGEHVLVGATVGEVPDARAYLLSQAVRFMPRIRSAALVDQWSGMRPATPDHAPVMGRMAAEGRYVATGHSRNGILLAPITAQIMADMILDARVADLAHAFAPARFGATA